MKQFLDNPLRLSAATWRVLFAGLLLRLALMPFTAHSDLMHLYWGGHQIAFHGEFAGFQSLLRYAHAGYLWLITPLLPPIESLWPHLASAAASNPFAGPTVAAESWFQFVSQPQVYRTLFLLKLPYLFFDLGCVYLLTRLVADRAQSGFVLRFWWLNPLLIFAVYVFGRHEVITLFVIILSLYWIREGRVNRGLLALGLAIALRYYALFLLPFWVLALRAKWRERLLGGLLGLAPWLVVNLLGWALSGTVEAKGLALLPHDNYLLAAKIEIAAWDNVYLFPLAYALLLLHRLYNRASGLPSLVRYSLVALLLLFATAYTGQSPHYWTWLLPLLALVTAEDRRLLPLHVAQILCLVVYSFLGGRSTAGYLFAPLSPDFFWSLPSPVQVLARVASPEVVIGLARTLFSALSLWMAYLVFRRAKGWGERGYS